MAALHTVKLSGTAERRQKCERCHQEYVYSLTRTANTQYSTSSLSLTSTNETKKLAAINAAEEKLRNTLSHPQEKDATRCPYCQNINEKPRLRGQVREKSGGASALIVAGLVFLGLGVTTIVLSITLSENIRQAAIGISVSAPVPILIGTVMLWMRKHAVARECNRLTNGGTGAAVQTGRPAVVIK